MSGPIRGLHDVEGQLYTVSGPTLYRITPAGVAIPLGQIPGVGRVSMAHNQVAGGHQLTIVNGVGGYVWNTANQQFNVITDEGFPGSSRVDFIDGYMMHVEPFGRFLLHSDLADALDFNTLDRFEAETAPDRTTTLIVNGTEVWAFGERTIDVFYNAGTAQGTFQNKKVGITTGCIAGASPAICDGGVAWLGDDRVVYHARGYSPTRISTRALDVVLSECSLSDIRNAFSFVYADRGHTIYYLTIPNGMTFGYDFSTGLWHRRASWHPEKDIYGRWCLSDLVRSNGKWIGGDYRTGKLYELDWDYPLEGCEPLIRERTSPIFHNNGDRVEVHEVQPIFDTGRPSVECVPFPYQPVGPQISGEAPDGLTSEPYSFTYTTTQGTAPISRTVLRDVELPAGWSWNEQTATISHDDTPVPTGSINLRMRVYDTSGLFSDHEDTFLVVVNYSLLVTGSSILSGDPMFARAHTLGELEFEGIPLDEGADIANAKPAYHDGMWLAVGTGECRYTDSDLVGWQSADTPWDGVAVESAVGGPDGWIVLSAQYDYDGQVAKASQVPDDMASYSFNTDPGGTVSSLSFIKLVGGHYYAAWAGSSSGTLMRNSALSGEWEQVCDVSTSTPGFSGHLAIRHFLDIVEFRGALYGAVVQKTNIADQLYQIRRSTNGGETWPDVLYSTDRNGIIPFQLEVGGDLLVAYCWGGEYTLTLDDDFATPHATGIRTSKAILPMDEKLGRQIVYAAPYFYVISGGSSDLSKSNKCVRSLDGQSFDAPVSIPLANAAGIATDYEEPEDD